jgi:hypothetical protein
MLLALFLFVTVLACFGSRAYADDCKTGTIVSSEIPFGPHHMSTVLLPDGRKIFAGQQLHKLYEIYIEDAATHRIETRFSLPKMSDAAVLMSAACLMHDDTSLVVLAFQFAATGYSGEYYALYGKSQTARIIKLAQTTQARLLMKRGDTDSFAILEPADPSEGMSDWSAKLYNRYEIRVNHDTAYRTLKRKAIDMYDPRCITDTPIAFSDQDNSQTCHNTSPD